MIDVGKFPIFRRAKIPDFEGKLSVKENYLSISTQIEITQQPDFEISTVQQMTFQFEISI